MNSTHMTMTRGVHRVLYWAGRGDLLRCAVCNIWALSYYMGRGFAPSSEFCAMCGPGHTHEPLSLHLRLSSTL